MRRKVLWVIFAIILLLCAWIRLSPNPVEKWHVDPTVDYPKTQNNYQTLVADIDQADPLRLLPAMPNEKATILAGRPEDGFVTYEIRTPLLKFPDFLSAKLTDDGLHIYSRSRFGISDWGQNKKRAQAWIEQLKAQ